jgi:hypothetical protein
MVFERPPAGRFAPQLSPFVRGTLLRLTVQQPWNLGISTVDSINLQICRIHGGDSKVVEVLNGGASVPLRRGTAVERSDRQGVARDGCRRA